MILCIDARLPLVLVGKPGSSKSLAMQALGTGFVKGACPCNHVHFRENEIVGGKCSKVSVRFKSV